MPQSTGSERRKAVRHACSGAITVIPFPKSPITRPVKVKCFDVSCSGIGIIHHEPLRVGKQFALALRNPYRAVALYEVVRCRTNPSGGFQIGALLRKIVRLAETRTQTGSTLDASCITAPIAPDAEAAAEVARIREALSRLQ